MKSLKEANYQRQSQLIRIRIMNDVLKFHNFSLVCVHEYRLVKLVMIKDFN